MIGLVQAIEACDGGLIVRGRHSEVVIKLTPEQRQELEERARQRKAPHGEVVRARALLMAADGERNVSIAIMAGVDARTVATWRLEFQERGLECLHERHRSGRPGQFSPCAEGGCSPPGVPGARPASPNRGHAGDPERS